MHSKIHLCACAVEWVLKIAHNCVKSLHSRYKTVPSYPQIPSYPFVVNLSPDLQFLATTDLFSVPIVLPFLYCHINRTLEYIAFGIWLLSLHIMRLRSLHVASCISSLCFLLLSSILLYMYHSLFILTNWRTFGFYSSLGWL